MNAKAQAWKYHPMPDSNAVWRVDLTNMTCAPFLYATYQYTLEGDSIIGSYTYSKVYKSGITSICTGQSYFSNYAGGMRNDTINKKVYFVCPACSEKILYDFSLNVGDTMHVNAFWDTSIYPYSVIIGSIDSILIGNNFHKQYNYGADVFIEGVGSLYGLIEGPPGFEVGLQLACFTHNADIYPNTNTSCPLITPQEVNIPELQNKTTLELSPNPNNGSFTITSNNPQLKTIHIYNVLGEEVFHSEIRHPELVEGQKFEIITNDLPTGIYFVKVSSEKEVLTKMMVKQ